MFKQQREGRGIILFLVFFLILGHVWCQEGIAQEPIKIGLLVPMSGPFAAGGIESKRAADIALDEIGGKVLGRPLEIVLRDDETNPGVAVRRARELIEKENIQFLIGSISTSVALAVMKVAEEKKIPYISLCSGDEVTGQQCNRYTFRHQSYGDLQAWTTVLPMIQKFKTKTFYAIVVDYSWGNFLIDGMNNVMKQEGAKLLGISRFPIGETDFSNHISKAMAAKPDVIIAISWGRDTAQLVKQLHQFDAHKNSKILVPGFDIPDFKAVGCENVANTYTGLHWWFRLDNPVTKVYMKKYQDRYGSLDNVGINSIESYIDVKIIAQAIKAAGSTDAEKFMKALLQEEFVNYYGEKTRFQAFNHQAIRSYLFTRAKSCDEKKDPLDYAEILDQKAYAVKKEQSSCNLEK